MKKLSIPSVTDYKPLPKKDDGFITKIHLFVEGRPSTRTYTGKMSKEEISRYIDNEFTNCIVLVESVMYYQYVATEMINQKFNAK